MPEVILVLPVAYAYSRDVARGVASYARLVRGWRLKLAPMPQPTSVLREWRESLIKLAPDGIIAQLAKVEPLRALRTVAPIVNVDTSVDVGVPTVRPDNRAAGKLVAEHFHERRLRSLAFVGLAGQEFSVQRRDGFVDAAREHGLPVAVADLSPTGSSRDLSHKIAAWAASLPRPIGLMACYDHLALRAIVACRALGLSVPDDVAIAGADNDDLACDFAPVPLSSVDLNAYTIGFQAAARLYTQLRRPTTPVNLTLVPPRGVLLRQSSDLVAVEDPEVAEALRFIRRNGHRPITVHEVLDAVAVGRRTLELRFRKLLNRSLQEEIYRSHVERAKELLLGTELSLAEVARQSGFRWVEHFSQRFRSITGTTPGRYRKQFADLKR